MDAPLYGVGRFRPESSASSHSRLTPQSSNNSSANLPNRSQSGMRERGRLQDGSPGLRRESPGSSLLQERLKEKKVARLSERHDGAAVDGSHDEVGQKGSPQLRAGSFLGRDRDGRPSSSGGRSLPLGKKGMGIKEMEDVSVQPLAYLSCSTDFSSVSFYSSQAEFRPQTGAFSSTTATN